MYCYAKIFCQIEIEWIRIFCCIITKWWFVNESMIRNRKISLEEVPFARIFFEVGNVNTLTGGRTVSSRYAVSHRRRWWWVWNRTERRDQCVQHVRSEIIDVRAKKKCTYDNRAKAAMKTTEHESARQTTTVVVVVVVVGLPGGVFTNATYSKHCPGTRLH